MPEARCRMPEAGCMFSSVFPTDAAAPPAIGRLARGGRGLSPMNRHPDPAAGITSRKNRTADDFQFCLLKEMDRAGQKPGTLRKAHVDSRGLALADAVATSADDAMAPCSSPRGGKSRFFEILFPPSMAEEAGEEAYRRITGLMKATEKALCDAFAPIMGVWRFPDIHPAAMFSQPHVTLLVSETSDITYITGIAGYAIKLPLMKCPFGKKEGFTVDQARLDAMMAEMAESGVTFFDDPNYAEIFARVLPMYREVATDETFDLLRLYGFCFAVLKELTENAHRYGQFDENPRQAVWDGMIQDHLDPDGASPLDRYLKTLKIVIYSDKVDISMSEY